MSFGAGGRYGSLTQEQLEKLFSQSAIEAERAAILAELKRRRHAEIEEKIKRGETSQLRPQPKSAGVGLTSTESLRSTAAGVGTKRDAGKKGGLSSYTQSNAVIQPKKHRAGITLVFLLIAVAVILFVIGMDRRSPSANSGGISGRNPIASDICETRYGECQMPYPTRLGTLCYCGGDPGHIVQ